MRQTMLRWGFIHRSIKCKWSPYYTVLCVWITITNLSVTNPCISDSMYSFKPNGMNILSERKKNVQGERRKEGEREKETRFSRIKLMHSFSKALANISYSTNNMSQRSGIFLYTQTHIYLYSFVHSVDVEYMLAIHFPRDVNGNNEMLSMWTYQAHINSQSPCRLESYSSNALK